jgi:hypothetical protein
MDWSILKKICVGGLLVSLAISLRPWATCTFERMNNAQISSIADGGTPGDSDVDRIGEAGSFSGGFFGSLPICYRAYPIGRADWQLPTLLGFFVGFLLFRQLQQHEYVSRVRKASGAHIGLAEERRKTLERESVSGGFDRKQKKPEQKKRSLDDERADW